jgi:hypothetical protein
MNRLPRLFLPLLAALISAVALTACGGSHPPTAHGEGEGSYIQAGSLIYQVQMSRELNPANIEDVEYLEGLPADEPPLRGDEEWFGVWLRVQNATDEDHVSATEFRVVDTLGTEYETIVLPATNPFSYQAQSVKNENDATPVYPDPESGAGGGPIKGSMILFRFNTAVYSNRPLELEITPPDGGEPSTVVLDL